MTHQLALLGLALLLTMAVVLDSVLRHRYRMSVLRTVETAPITRQGRDAAVLALASGLGAESTGDPVRHQPQPELPPDAPPL
ncbi:hypothetical protein JGS22_012315 [Streptomyces sp. P38-E01]|uniref:Uncharacterized protein n=1 Tax=Streptomyces tardus TaxID=2780544 RepID=A0A949JGZ2_9ACTN|nr:hypothetical protein [Streptomyces tardus]MBU7598379.1 hypothetical protein [Streptomyces tardus]